VVHLVALGVAELADRHVQGGADGSSQPLVRTCLELARSPVRANRGRPQRIEQHGLAHATQTGQDDGALGFGPGDALEHHVEGAQLVVSAGELWRALAGARGVRISDGVHDRRLYTCIAYS
jgi:hypothetical protein